MAINMNSHQNGTSRTRCTRHSRRHQAPMSEINVTPMVDVMLVLLIIFMVAAPLLTVGVPVNLPKTGAKPLTGDNEPLAITVKTDGRVFLQDTAIETSNLVSKLRAISETGYEERIYVRGDKDVAYGDVADVVARINAAGFSKVALVTDLKSGQDDK